MLIYISLSIFVSRYLELLERRGLLDDDLPTVFALNLMIWQKIQTGQLESLKRYYLHDNPLEYQLIFGKSLFSANYTPGIKNLDHA